MCDKGFIKTNSDDKTSVDIFMKTECKIFFFREIRGG